MGENTNLIEQDIRNTRSDLARNLDELGTKARELVSWQSQYRNHSQVFLGAAFGAGLVFGLAALPRRNDFRDVDDQPVFDGTEAYAVGLLPANGQFDGNGGNGGNGTVSRVKQELGDTWAAIADGLVRTASAKAVQFLSDLVPGFSEHVEGRYAAPRSRTWRDPNSSNRS